MRVTLKVGLGALLGPLAPMVLAGYVPSSLAELRTLILFGSIFGGSMAYFLHRYRHVQRTRGAFVWTSISGAMAGGATAGMAYDLGHLTSAWAVPWGAGSGALIGAIAWLHGVRGK